MSKHAAQLATALSRLKLVELRVLTIKCGLGSSGTKAKLRERLESAILADLSSLSPTARVLSIDLGIRNLALALVTPAASSPAGATTKGKRVLLKAPPGPVVHAWRRLSLGTATTPTAPLKVEFSGAEKARIQDWPNISESAAIPALISEVFTPLHLSRLTLNLIHQHLLPFRPTHVIVERQRWRTGGAAAVAEWTVRVNTLEAMLYAAFGTLQSIGAWDGVLVPVEPKHVVAYLFDGKEDEGSNVTTRYVKLKKMKVQLLRTWIEDGDKLEFSDREMVEELFASEEGKRRKIKRKDGGEFAELGAPSVQKLDDLADCLLQGLAWLRWQANIERLKAGKLDALLPPKQGVDVQTPKKNLARKVCRRKVVAHEST